MRRYDSKDWGFSIAHPEDWNVERENEPDAGLWVWAVAIAGASAKGGRPAVSVYVQPRMVPGENSTSGYVEQAKQELAHMFNGFRFNAEEKDHFQGAPTVTLGYSYDGGDGRIQEKNFTIFFPRKAYRIICEAPASGFQNFQPIFNNIVDSLRVFPAGRPSAAPGLSPAKRWWEVW